LIGSTVLILNGSGTYFTKILLKGVLFLIADEDVCHALIFYYNSHLGYGNMYPAPIPLIPPPADI
jgi:hypothetical protein